MLKEHSKLKSFIYINAEIVLNARKIKKQIRLKIGKKLKNSRLTSKFNGSYKKKSVLHQIIELTKSRLLQKDMQNKANFLINRINHYLTMTYQSNKYAYCKSSAL